MVDISDVDRRVWVYGRARDERVHLWDEDDLIDAVHMHRAQLVRTDPTRRAASQFTERHCATLVARRSLQSTTKANVTIAIRLRYDYHPTTTYRAHLLQWRRKGGLRGACAPGGTVQGAAFGGEFGNLAAFLAN